MLYEVYDGDERIEQLENLTEAIDFAKSYIGAYSAENLNLRISLQLVSQDEIQRITKADTRSIGIVLESLFAKIKSFLDK
ncbi:hypothetical protein V6x_28250 [Gimesia chilikensis]|uniref:Uncharacterized protein n=2 Tax=Gimesia chilikensis TaxID=2605989 RepID=A0A517WCY1_9PLAN|nr:hypothetical protein V6x_28250 [Gimesia chilikensis]